MKYWGIFCGRSETLYRIFSVDKPQTNAFVAFCFFLRCLVGVIVLCNVF